MREFSRFCASRAGIITAGGVIGVLAPLLVKLGNPGNMGICVACFERDIAGSLGLHRTPTVQYLRPEVIGLVLGSTVAALLFGEFRARGGSAPLLRFVLGVFAMIGALVFLGCPWRANLRLAGGDLNALLGLAGLVVGIGVGTLFMKRGYTLGRSKQAPAAVGWIMPALMVILLVLAIARPVFVPGGPLFFSVKGPGSMHAPLVISLAVGLLIGFLAQRTRFCTMGAIRDIILMRDFHLASGIAALLVAAFAMNLVLGQFHPGFAGQPVAHSDHLWNFLGMVLSGLAFSLAGGCPGRQLFLSGEGDGDSLVFVLGMVTGAALAHTFSFAGSPDAVKDGVTKIGGIGQNGMIAVGVGLVVCLTIGALMRERAPKEETHVAG